MGGGRKAAPGRFEEKRWGTKESTTVLQMALSWLGSKALPGCGWIPAVLAGCRVKCHQCCSVDTGGIDLHSPQMRGGLCFWVAPGLTLPKAKLRHVPASIQCYHCLSVEQGRKNGIPGLSLWWGWFLDKWAVSEECLKCKDTQECWCKLEVWRAEEKSQLVSPPCCWYVMQSPWDWIKHSTFLFCVDSMGTKRKKRYSYCNGKMFIWGRAGRILLDEVPSNPI